jgi:DNA polymerase III delta subunit
VITIIFGTDRLSIEERIASIRGDVDPSSFATTIIEDAARNIAEVISACGALGFFGSGRLIVAHQLLAASPRRGRRSKANDEQESAIDVLRGVPPETTLLIVEGALDNATEREARRAAPELKTERFDVPRGQALVEWTCARARRQLAVIKQADARQLLEALFPGSWQAAGRRDDVAPNLFRLDSELAKLAVAAGEHGTITAASITSLVYGADEEDFWGVTNAIMQGDVAKAVSEIERAYAQGSAAEGILGQLTSQFEVLAIASLAGKSTGIGDLAASSGLSEARLRQAGRYIAMFPPERISRALDALRAIDAGDKQGALDLTDSLVPLIASLARGSRVSQ